MESFNYFLFTKYVQVVIQRNKSHFAFQSLKTLQKQLIGNKIHVPSPLLTLFKGGDFSRTAICNWPSSFSSGQRRLMRREILRCWLKAFGRLWCYFHCRNSRRERLLVALVLIAWCHLSMTFALSNLVP